MAEWYKRRYRGGNKSELVANLDLETLWTNAGINKKLYLYKDDSSNKRWLYSIYVLGGLAIKHELSRNDNMKFLKGLCRIDVYKRQMLYLHAFLYTKCNEVIYAMVQIGYDGFVHGRWLNHLITIFIPYIYM